MGVPLATFILLLFAGLAVCPSVLAQERFRIVAYNCENLFDTVHDHGKDDLAFLPSSTRRWNGFKYWRKLTHLSKTIIAAGEGLLPDLVALCEVENDTCMYALTKRAPLRWAGYEYVMTDSPDRRGIDVALLYQPGTFRLLSYQSYRIPVIPERQRPTRDILHATGMVRTMDTLDVFVCHLPSRAGGRKATENFRCRVAAVIKRKADSVAAVRQNPCVVITGDFNDEPFNRSLLSFAPDFVLLTDATLSGSYHPGEVKGTYYYKGEWNRLDHILVNKSLYEKSHSFHLKPSVRARILDFPFLLEEDKTYRTSVPYRFYKGYRYNGGYSDHLPVHVDFIYE